MNTSKLNVNIEPMIKGIIKVREFGIKKYDRDNWKTLTDPIDLYNLTNAMERHWLKHLSGEINDNESGLNHLFHMATNIAFLIDNDQINNIDKCFSAYLTLGHIVSLNQSKIDFSEFTDQSTKQTKNKLDIGLIPPGILCILPIIDQYYNKEIICANISDIIIYISRYIYDYKQRIIYMFNNVTITPMYLLAYVITNYISLLSIEENNNENN